ncbi:MAG: hypothetical protein E6K81_13600 [Candidatus Eisenbacteria bacterium]|uniref:Outer membrane protein beta-barrel domain-containing protein n=1 Tax=Eiseniibacteriota bacterium TaxID=2212470 RepID=A0A538U2M1_UNCEI|nr:MAG: hypothetical protein E6K81_13600 [Candidatus Eisenbacteria bacterium]
MSRSAYVVMAIVMFFACGTASGASWSVGSHFEISTIHSERPGSGSSTVVAWPANAFTYQPAFRIAVGNASHTGEVLLDSGCFFLDEAGSTLNLFVSTLSFQHTFLAGAATAAFANAGAGIFREGGAARSSTTATFGGGIGVRRIVGEKKGAVRAELRVDRLHSDNVVGRPALNVVGLRFGFDLWL